MAERAEDLTARLVATCLLLAVIASGIGCYSKNPGYPASWAPIKLSEDIESIIEGSYECSGTEHNGRRSSIYSYLFGGNARCDRITVRRIGDDALEIRLIDGEFMIAGITYKKGVDYRVADNWIMLNPKSESKAEDIVAVRTSFTHCLGVDSDYSLIVKNKESGVGVIVVVPVGGSETKYSRFKRIR